MNIFKQNNDLTDLNIFIILINIKYSNGIPLHQWYVLAMDKTLLEISFTYHQSDAARKKDNDTQKPHAFRMQYGINNVCVYMDNE